MKLPIEFPIVVMQLQKLCEKGLDSAKCCITECSWHVRLAKDLVSAGGPHVASQSLHDLY